MTMYRRLAAGEHVPLLEKAAPFPHAASKLVRVIKKAFVSLVYAVLELSRGRNSHDASISMPALLVDGPIGSTPVDSSSPSAAVFRSVMSAFPTSVVAIAGINVGTGSPTGLAVGTFASISLDPPLAGFFVAKTSTSWPLIETSESFCASLLSHSQQKLARQLSTRGTDKFAGVDWRPAPSGSPIIEDSLAWVDCVDVKTIEVGDHLLVLGTIIACEASDVEARAMGFHRSKMGGIALCEV
jgi:3-hydroxy-9,10-secoandrosta-1,3,5(10)-triene-9,17-dione monooxygenase reductase component